MLRALASLVVVIAAVACRPAHADPFRIVLIEDRSAPHESEARHAEEGFRLGLEYATAGSLRVGGRDIAVAMADDRGDPATAARLLEAAFGDGEADFAVAADSSAAARAMLPVAARCGKLLLVAHAPADAITGASGNRYVFRSGASASQMAIAGALALGRPELNLSVVAQDDIDGRDAVAALKAALAPTGTFFISSYFLPPDVVGKDADIGRTLSAQYEDLHGLHGASTLLTLWTGSHPPIDAIAATEPGRFGIRLGLSGEIEPTARPAGPRVEIDGVTAYFHSLPHNAANDFLIAAWGARFGERPDGFAASGMTAALAAVAALSRAPAGGTNDLIAAMEGMRFATPKGEMVFRREDHQALQAVYQFRWDPQAASGLPELVHEFATPEIKLPIRAGRD
jgi:branched-chain amino acid transport system substrate-binding protein